MASAFNACGSAMVMMIAETEVMRATAVSAAWTLGMARPDRIHPLQVNVNQATNALRTSSNATHRTSASRWLINATRTTIVSMDPTKSDVLDRP